MKKIYIHIVCVERQVVKMTLETLTFNFRQRGFNLKQGVTIAGGWPLSEH